MKAKKVIALLSLSFVMGIGAFAALGGLSSKEAEPVAADHPTPYGNSGTIYLRLDTGDWKYSGSKICLYMFNNSESKAGWGDFVTPNGTDTYVEYSYNLDFTPTACIAWRLDPGVETMGDWVWESDRGNPAIWSTTNDIDFNHVIWLGNYYTDSKWTESGSFGLSAVVVGGASDDWTGDPTVDTALTNVKSDGSNLEVYGTVSLPANSYFKVLKTGSQWCGTYTAHPSIASNLENTVGEGNIHNTNAATYAFSFHYDTPAIYITDPVIAEADEWAQYFLANVGCDPNGVNLPTGWSDCATEYGKLSGGAKDIIYGATGDPAGSFVEQAVARYDVAVAHHSELSHFIVSSSSVVRPGLVGYTPASVANNDEGNIGYLAIIAVASVLSISAIIVLVAVKKRKHN